jgi:protein involved in polysaccharide export with SLBB domain
MRTAILGATLFFVALSCTSASAARLHPGDQVDVFVYNHPELSGTRTLDASGSISLPLAGTVQAAGLEPAALAKRVRANLTAYVRHAAVDVRLAAQTTSLFVDGGPIGVLKYEPGETLTSAVDKLAESAPAQATAPNANAEAATSGIEATSVNADTLDLSNGPQDFHVVRIERDGAVLGPYDAIALRADGEPGPTLYPGDTIKIAHKPVAVRITGAVRRPGTNRSPKPSCKWAGSRLRARSTD